MRRKSKQGVKPSDWWRENTGKKKLTFVLSQLFLGANSLDLQISPRPSQWCYDSRCVLPLWDPLPVCQRLTMILWRTGPRRQIMVPDDELIWSCRWTRGSSRGQRVQVSRLKKLSNILSYTWWQTPPACEFTYFTSWWAVYFSLLFPVCLVRVIHVGRRRISIQCQVQILLWFVWCRKKCGMKAQIQMTKLLINDDKCTVCIRKARGKTKECDPKAGWKVKG